MQSNLKSELDVHFPWQNMQWERLISQMDSEKLPHAINLIGPSCIGKQNFALSFANFILCRSASKKVPCGKCKSCCLSRSSNHPDLITIKPDSKGKNINVGSIRELDTFFSQTSQQGGWKVVVISSAESMNASAANALLKSLEEPKEKTLIMLVCHDPSRLLITVKSRCQQLIFPIPDRSKVKFWLEKKLPDAQDINELIEQANGRPILAMNLIDTDFIQARREFNDLLDSLALNDASPVDAAELYKKNDPELIIDWLYYKLVSEIKSKEKITSLVLSFHYMDKLFQSKRLIQSSANPNLQLIWEELFMNWKHLFASR
jgi:DNA polymerase-3 subunit delta'|tara:strand:- start:368 stop:1321 length:954 start_codon:yes stop_codon:yes gene_type:complete